MNRLTLCKIAFWMFVSFLVLACLSVAGMSAHAQIVKIRDLPGATVADKISFAQAHNCDSRNECIIWIDPELSAYPTGSLPAKCSGCDWMDWRTGVPTGGSGASTTVANTWTAKQTFSTTYSSAGIKIAQNPGFNNPMSYGLGDLWLTGGLPVRIETYDGSTIRDIAWFSDLAGYAPLTSPSFTGPVTVGVAGGVGGTVMLPEGTAATASAGNAVLYADSTSHTLKLSTNGGSFVDLGAGGGGGGFSLMKLAYVGFTDATVGITRYFGNLDVTANTGSNCCSYGIPRAGQVVGFTGRCATSGSAPSSVNPTVAVYNVTTSTQTSCKTSSVDWSAMPLNYNVTGCSGVTFSENDSLAIQVVMPAHTTAGTTLSCGWTIALSLQ